MKKEHPIDESRVYLFGHSSGAEFGLMMGLLESEYFAAVAVHAGGLHKENSNVFEYSKRKVPVYLIIGDRDQLVPLDAVENTKKMFAERGFPVSVNEMKGHTHDYYDSADAINKDVWAFFAKSQVPTPYFQEYLSK
jgi:predicted esterase